LYMNTNTFRFGLSFAIATILMGVLFAGSAFAQTQTTATASVGVAAPAQQTCPPGLIKNLWRGTQGDGVSALQQTLSMLGYFNANATGYFGPITFNALVAFQRAEGVPTTGYFGPLSFAALSRRCGNPGPNPIPKVSFSADPTSGKAPLDVSFMGTGVTGGSQYIIDFGDGAHSEPLAAIDVCMHLSDGSGGCPKVQTNHTYATNGTYTATLQPYISCMWSNPRCMIATMPLGTVTITVGAEVSATPRIDRVSPAHAQMGENVAITGTGFSTDAIVDFYQNGVSFGSTKDLTVVDSGHITLTVPEWVGPRCRPYQMCTAMARPLPDGVYTIAVETNDGVSNQVAFTKGSSSISNALSISGLDAPTSLPIGTPGTWTVHVNTSSSNQNLHYSVVWGDEGSTDASIMAPMATTIQTTATFTHAYHTSGTRTPVFSVTDDAGHSVSTSASVTVTPLY
jgi:hypothetical protein